MRATLIHNAGAGDSASPDGARLVNELEGLGWRVTPRDPSQLDRAFEDPGDVVVVAGGDGTVGRVAKHSAASRVPIAVVPVGTANNVARTLGIDLDPATAIRGLRDAVVREVDLGVASAEHRGQERFIEGFGVGVFAYVMAERATDEHKEIRRASALLATELARYRPLRATVEADGKRISGDFLLISVMNLCSLGPALRLAPDASFDDGELDLVVVRPEERAAMLVQLNQAAHEGATLPLSLERHRAVHVSIRDCRQWAHADDRTHELRGDVEVGIEPRAVRFLVPR